MRISDWSSVLCSSDLELPHPEADDKLDDEIDGQRDRDPHDVARNGDDLASLEAEHCDDREAQRNERDRRDLRKEARLVPVIPLRAGQYLAVQEAGAERDDEIDNNGLGEGPEATVIKIGRASWRAKV